MVLIQLRGSLQSLLLLVERKPDLKLLAMVGEVVRLVRALDELIP